MGWRRSTRAKHFCNVHWSESEESAGWAPRYSACPTRSEVSMPEPFRGVREDYTPFLD
jgi:hypothetical protein